MGDLHDFRTRRPIVVGLKTTDATGSGGDGTMETRIARLEADVSHIKTDVADIKSDVRDLRSESRVDFRMLLGAGAVALCALLTVMAKGFGWL